MLKNTKLALTPHNGYEIDASAKQSTKARKYLRYLKENVDGYNKLQYIDNGGERRFHQYRLDGFIERENHERGNLAIEILGWYVIFLFFY